MKYDALNPELYDKSRNDLEENESSMEYWTNTAALIRRYRYHAKKKDFYENVR